MARVKTESTVVGAPEGQQVAQEVTKAKRKRKARKALYMVDGKVARKLESTPADYNRAKQRLTRGQFATMHAWFSHCAVEAHARYLKYQNLAAEAKAQPERFGRVGRNRALQSKIAVLEQALLAKGFTPEQIAALTPPTQEQEG